jgi:hypothetical protein
MIEGSKLLRHSKLLFRNVGSFLICGGFSNNNIGNINNGSVRTSQGGRGYMKDQWDLWDDECRPM